MFWPSIEKDGISWNAGDGTNRQTDRLTDRHHNLLTKPANKPVE